MVTKNEAGSPPRMRGAAIAISAPMITGRITPAYAGSSFSSCFKASLKADHPRVCGEQNVADEETNAAIGSPPRMRGAGRPRKYAWQHPGITPAYAGSSCWNYEEWNRDEDHPRVCGEQPFTYNFMNY